MWELGGQKSNQAALSLNGQKSEIRSSNFVKSEVWSLKYEVFSLKSEVGSRKLEVGSLKSEVRKSWKKPLTEKKIFLYSCWSVFKILFKMRGQWIQISKNELLVKCGLPYFLMSLSFFLSLSFFSLFWSEEIYQLPGFCIIIAPFCPASVVDNVVRLFLPTSSNTAYSLSRTGIFAGFYCVPIKMDRSSVCPRQGLCFHALGKAIVLHQQVHRLLPSIKVINSPELFLATVFSWCWLLPSWTHHALEQRHSVNKWRRQAFACRLF